MAQESKYYIVEASALPEIILKVARAKQALEWKEAATVNEATRLVGISRSAFYKYRDAVHPLSDMMRGHIVTIQAMLKDEPGVLSSILNIFATSGGNILTINQSIPTGGIAAVTLSTETSGLIMPLEELVHKVVCPPSSRQRNNSQRVHNAAALWGHAKCVRLPVAVKHTLHG